MVEEDDCARAVQRRSECSAVGAVIFRRRAAGLNVLAVCDSA
jgi:hypothetical protein